jgi:hypothetical protein
MFEFADTLMTCRLCVRALRCHGQNSTAFKLTIFRRQLQPHAPDEKIVLTFLYLWRIGYSTSYSRPVRDRQRSRDCEVPTKCFAGGGEQCGVRRTEEQLPPNMECGSISAGASKSCPGCYFRRAIFRHESQQHRTLLQCGSLSIKNCTVMHGHSLYAKHRMCSQLLHLFMRACHRSYVASTWPVSRAEPLNSTPCSSP